METLPIENRSRSDIACPLAALMFDARGSERVQRESRNAHRVPKRAARLSRVGAARRTSRSGLRGVSKRIDAPYRSGPCKTWLKSKNPESEAVRREREEDWG